MSHDTFWWSHDGTFSLQVNQNANAQCTGTMALDHYFMPNTKQDFAGLVPNTYTSNIHYFNPRTFTTTDNRYHVWREIPLPKKTQNYKCATAAMWWAGRRMSTVLFAANYSINNSVYHSTNYHTHKIYVFPNNMVEKLIKHPCLILTNKRPERTIIPIVILLNNINFKSADQMSLRADNFTGVFRNRTKVKSK